ncbi:MAG: HAD family hydrolase [Nanoarchaeota archaeon]|nr:HAD family hydrolase [Nanoarchaeota archaeon]
MIKVVSFDLDGCITDEKVDELVWRKEIPEIYAREKHVDFDTAYKEVTSEYARLFKLNEKRWREMSFWFEHFKLKADWKKVMNGLKDHILLYGDVLPVISKLKQKYKVVLFSTANKDFLDLKLKTLKIDKLFDEVFISSDLGEMKKTAEAFRQMAKKLGVKPEEIVHIGDRQNADYNAPKAAGLHAFLIDRQGNFDEDFAVRNLYDFAEKLEELK